jgi:hypothetical protein
MHALCRHSDETTSVSLGIFPSAGHPLAPKYAAEVEALAPAPGATVQALSYSEPEAARKTINT